MQMGPIGDRTAGLQVGGRPLYPQPQPPIRQDFKTGTMETHGDDPLPTFTMSSTSITSILVRRQTAPCAPLPSPPRPTGTAGSRRRGGGGGGGRRYAERQHSPAGPPPRLIRLQRLTRAENAVRPPAGPGRHLAGMTGAAEESTGLRLCVDPRVEDDPGGRRRSPTGPVKPSRSDGGQLCPRCGCVPLLTRRDECFQRRTRKKSPDFYYLAKLPP
ncbi:unnamed protein product [Pleuronectes platessa]|uniref:Uncharacterized protein n=1 Tax=Pleuronectes platessa TaxID=8262 RepID=A0A9N7TKL8_PLEPL|nr:unnamed protein product [Pleuronectes platessa]